MEDNVPKRNATLVRVRENKGWTIRQLAIEAKVSEGTVRRAEKGLPVRRITMVRLAKALDERISELFPGEPD
jgi:transcriptional regulator with XRE-family HTH domain